MVVLKFGGTSVGNVENIKNVANIINNDIEKIVVLSAMSGTTNTLDKIAKFLYKKDNESATKTIKELEKKYIKTVDELFKTSTYKKIGKELIKSHFTLIYSFTQDLFTLFEEKTILAQGELLSTALFHYYLKEQNIKSELISALNFMRIDKDGEPDMFYIKENLERELQKHPNNTIFITQGYITRNVFGEIDNLKRG
ncbi:MAG TPA: aspartate kinase, partial [Flavobacteriia bacterium]|nr:aspartate kinase [Flavobacteriia bacterium]